MMRFYWPIAKLDHERRMVWGYATTEAEDDQGETIRRDAIAAALDDYMRFANIREMHQPSAVGVATEAQLDDKGLYLAAKIIDEEAWQKVVEGVYKGFSIGGRVTARDPQDRRIITGVSLTEISVVDRPANPEAVFDCWKRAGADAAAIDLAIGDEADADHEGDADAAGGERAAPLDYADPGFRPDGLPRYPIDSEPHIRAAWAYIHQQANAGRYSAAQLAHIRQRIAGAWRETIHPAGPPAAAPQPTRSAAGAAADRRPGESAPPLPRRLRQILEELCALLQASLDEDGGEGRDARRATDAAIAAMADASPLRAVERSDLTAIAGGLAKLADAIMPRLDALQQRVEEIAQTPLPPLTMARGFAGLTMRDDGGALPAADDIALALARLSEEERTLALIKAAHANPIIPTPRPPGVVRR